MHAQNRGPKWNSQRAVALRQHLLDFTQSLTRQRDDRWARAAEKRTEQVGMREAQGGIESRHKRLTRGLMQPVGEAFAEQRVIATLQRLEQKKDALHVCDGVFQWNRLRQSLTRALG